jgi:hypothetical protein
MEIAWREAPRVSGLPLPSQEIPVYVFRDREQFNAYTRQLLGAELGHGGCSALTAWYAERAILCNAASLRSRDATLDFVTHELVHHLVQGDLGRRRAVATWYNEGLAEAVMARVLAVHAPAYAVRDQVRRETIVGLAVHGGAYLPLSGLTTGHQWRNAASSDLAYSEARLAVSSLIDRHGMDSVVQVVRRTNDSAGSFDRAFQQAFGATVEEFDTHFEASLRGAGPLTATGWRALSCLLGTLCRP